MWCWAPQLRNGPVGSPGFHSITPETHKHCRVMFTFSRQRLPPRARGDQSPQMGRVSCLQICSSSRKESPTDTVPLGKQNLSFWGTGRGLVCTGESAKARMSTCVRPSGNKHETQPKLIREGCLLCAAHIILTGRESGHRMGKGSGGEAVLPTPCPAADLRQDTFPLGVSVSLSAKWG